MISKALIPVGGWGTRRLPITKAVEKCMLPIGNRPIVDYVVQDCIAAGITDIYFVVGDGSTQLQAYYGRNLALEEYLKENGKEALLSLVAPTQNVSFTYITQPSGNYGTAVPVQLAASYFEADESVVVLMGDDFLYSPDGSSEVARLLQATPEGECSMLGVQVAPQEVQRYGVLEYTEHQEFVRIVEKPLPENAPSNLINVSKYVLNSAAIQEIIQYVEGSGVKGEYHITDPINTYVEKGGKMRIVPAKGQYLDGGSVEGWLHANQVVLSS